MIPRVWAALERDLAHPALEPVARWFDANIPDTLRFAHGAFAA
jgi:Predicted phosphotransferase related to Ser/Thr protein kinases